MINFEHIIWDWQGVLWKNGSLNQELIDWIRESKYDNSILTNCGGDFSQILEKNKINELFFTVVSPTRNNVLKPSKGAYQKILEITETEPEKCIFVDDSAINVRAANSLGLKSILYKNNRLILNKLTKLIT